jgi:uncharacterized membrane protein YoaT (DUF817 family)
MNFDIYEFVGHMKDGSLMLLAISCAMVFSRTIAVYVGTAQPFIMPISHAVMYAALYVFMYAIMKYYFPPKNED